jgi:hemolysin activation/secretion protein
MGNRSTGLLQKTGTLTFDSPLRWGDQLSLNALHTDGSDYVRTDYSLPLGYAGLRATAFYSHLSYTNIGAFAYPANANAGTGTAESRGVGLMYPWLRSSDANLNLTLQYEQKTYNNRLASTNSYTSVYTLNNYNLGLSGNRYDNWWGGGVFSGALNVIHGRIDFSANNPNNYGLYTPKDYLKTSLSLTRNQQVISEKYNLLISLSGQLASVDLDPAEKFFLGGPYGVRAYPASQSGGSQGAVMNIELQRQLPYQLQASVFVDAGYIDQYKNKATYIQMLGNTHANNNYALFGAGLGLKYIDKVAIVSSSVSLPIGNNPLYNSTGLAVNADGLSKKAYFWIQGQYFF